MSNSLVAACVTTALEPHIKNLAQAKLNERGAEVLAQDCYHLREAPDCTAANTVTVTAVLPLCRLAGFKVPTPRSVAKLKLPQGTQWPK